MPSKRVSFIGDLFPIPRPAEPIPASMNYRRIVSALVAGMLAEAAAAGIDRWEVASRASRLTGKDISKLMLDGYTAESREEFNAPFWLTPVLESVCSSTRLTEWLASVRGGKLLVGADTLDAEVGRLERERDQTTNRLRELKEIQRRAR